MKHFSFTMAFVIAMLALAGMVPVNAQDDPTQSAADAADVTDDADLDSDSDDGADDADLDSDSDDGADDASDDDDVDDSDDDDADSDDPDDGADKDSADSDDEPDDDADDDAGIDNDGPLNKGQKMELIRLYQSDVGYGRRATESIRFDTEISLSQRTIKHPDHRKLRVGGLSLKGSLLIHNVFGIEGEYSASSDTDGGGGGGIRNSPYDSKFGKGFVTLGTRGDKKFGDIVVGYNAAIKIGAIYWSLQKHKTLGAVKGQVNLSLRPEDSHNGIYTENEVEAGFNHGLALLDVDSVLGFEILSTSTVRRFRVYFRYNYFEMTDGDLIYFHHRYSVGLSVSLDIGKFVVGLYAEGGLESSYYTFKDGGGPGRSSDGLFAGGGLKLPF